MTSLKKLTAALLALVAVFTMTFNFTTSAQAATATDPLAALQKYTTQISELKTSYDQLAPLFKQGAWDQVEEALPGLNKSLRSALTSLSKKAPPELQESLNPLVASVTSYFDELEGAKTSYKTAKSTYKKAESTYEKDVESDLDKIDDGLDSLLKFLPKTPKAPKK